MKKLILLIFLLPFLVIAQTNYYISPTGSNTAGDGSYGNPWFGVGYAINQCSPGDTVQALSGTYYYDSEQTIYVSGTEGNYITLKSYANHPDSVVFDFWNYDATDTPPATSIYGIKSYESYLRFERFSLRRLWRINTDDGRAHGMYFQSSNFIDFMWLQIDSIAGRGIQGYNSGTANVINCDFTWCADPRDGSPGNAGVGIIWFRSPSDTYSLTDTLRITGSRFWRNADQGIEQMHGNVAIVDNSWFFSNGIRTSFPSWQEGITYNTGDTIRRSSPNYIALQESTDIEPEVTAGWELYWQRFVHPYNYWGGAGLGVKGGLTSSSVHNTPLTLTRSIMLYNYGSGFITNVAGSGGYKPILDFYNNLVYGNGNFGVSNQYYENEGADRETVYRNNISFNNGLRTLKKWDFLDQSTEIGAIHDHNSWNCIDCSVIDRYWISPGVVSEQFVSVPDSTANFALMTAPRQADGSLPDLGDYWQLASTSDLINAGIYVGLPYTGSAPDLGPFEYTNFPVADILANWTPFTFNPLYGVTQTTTIINAYNTQWSDAYSRLSLLKNAFETLTGSTITWNNTPIVPLSFSMRGMDIRNAINNNNAMLFLNMDALYQAIVALRPVPEYEDIEVTIMITPTPQQFVSLYNWNIGTVVNNTTEMYNVLNANYGY